MLYRRINTIAVVPITIDLALLILRVSFSLLMISHGYAKLSQALQGDFSFADPIGLGEGLSLILTIFAEFFCSILVVFGLFTRIALLPLIFTMLVAALLVHGGQGLNEMEHALLYFIVYVVLFITGPGRFSADSLFFNSLQR